VFRGFRFPAKVTLWAVRWYLQFPISYRDLERMLADRGVTVDHTTMYRWVHSWLLREFKMPLSTLSYEGNRCLTATLRAG